MLYKTAGRDRESIMQDGGVDFDTMLIGFFTRFFSPTKLSCRTDQTYKCLGSQTMGGFVFRRVQEGYHSEPAITRERKHFSKIHPSDCKPSTRLACSYLNWSEEVSAALCSAVDRTSKRMNDKTTTVTLRPRVNKSM